MLRSVALSWLIISEPNSVSFIISGLNSCMNKKKALTLKQRDIQNKQHQDDWLRIKWQNQNGLDDKDFATLPLIILQAQVIATNILKAGGDYLEQNKAASLNNFLKALRNGSKRKKLKEADAYRVMNIGKQVHRKMFKAYKAIN